MGLSVQRVVVLTRFRTSFLHKSFLGLDSVIRSLMGIVSDTIHQRTSKASALLEIHRFLLKNLANLDGFCVLLHLVAQMQKAVNRWLSCGFGYWWAFL